MPEKQFIIILNESTRIVVFLKTKQGKPVKFTIKLEIFINKKWVEIERYDTHHNCVHKDILNKSGKKKRVIKYEFIDIKSGLNMAIEDFDENHEIYTRRYLNG